LTAPEAFEALIRTLRQIQSILPADKTAWDDDWVLQLAIERLWILAGNLSETYRLEVGIPAGVEPWSELAAYRNILAHALPGDISSDRVYADSSTDVETIIETLLQGLDQR
jgi:uncharacterized protein with HEPN domain